MNLEIRKMRPEEAKDTKKVFMKAFGLMGMLHPKPKDALIAVLDGQIVGGFVYKIKKSGKKTAGYVSLLFIHPEVQGKGIGRQLGDAGVQHMWDEGCDVITTFVRDDNVGSWQTFKSRGFVRGSWPTLVKEAGLVAGIVNLGSYWLAPFHDYYIAKKDGGVQEKGGSLKQMGAFMLLNALLILLLVRTFSIDVLWVIGSLLFVLVGGALASGIGTLFSRERKWSFRMTTGGIAISLLVVVLSNGFFPVFGNVYPAKYENTPKFRRDMAFVAIAAWLFYAAVTVLVKVDILPAGADFAASIFLFMKCLPFDFFGSLGGERVWRWNKPLFVILAAASVFLLWWSGALGFLPF